MRASREVSGHELEDDQNDLLTLECSSFLPMGGHVHCTLVVGIVHMNGDYDVLSITD